MFSKFSQIIPYWLCKPTIILYQQIRNIRRNFILALFIFFIQFRYVAFIRTTCYVLLVSYIDDQYIFSGMYMKKNRNQKGTRFCFCWFFASVWFSIVFQFVCLVFFSSVLNTRCMFENITFQFPPYKYEYLYSF